MQVTSTNGNVGGWGCEKNALSEDVDFVASSLKNYYK